MIQEYRLRMTSVSLEWAHVFAESEEDAIDKFASILEKNNSTNKQKDYRDRFLWQVEKVANNA